MPVAHCHHHGLRKRAAMSRGSKKLHQTLQLAQGVTDAVHGVQRVLGPFTKALHKPGELARHSVAPHSSAKASTHSPCPPDLCMLHAPGLSSSPHPATSRVTLLMLPPACVLPACPGSAMRAATGGPKEAEASSCVEATPGTAEMRQPCCTPTQPACDLLSKHVRPAFTFLLLCWLRAAVLNEAAPECTWPHTCCSSQALDLGILHHKGCDSPDSPVQDYLNKTSKDDPARQHFKLVLDQPLEEVVTEVSKLHEAAGHLVGPEHAERHEPVAEDQE